MRSTFYILLNVWVFAVPYCAQEFPFISMGATDTKEFFISLPDYVKSYADAIASCKIVYGMNLASVETDAELAVIDSYFTATQGNVSDLAWTSYISMGDIGPKWATKGIPVENIAVDTPWPAGGGGSPMYAWYKCGTIRLACSDSAFTK